MTRYYFFSLLCELVTALFQCYSTVALLDANLSFQDTASAFAANAIAIAFLEVPTGLFADRRGRRMSSIVGLLLGAGACGLLVASPTPMVAVVSMILQGLGATFVSGAKDAWLINRASDMAGRNLTGDEMTRVTLWIQLSGRVAILLALHLGAALMGKGPGILWGACAVVSIASAVFAATLKRGSTDLAPPASSQASIIGAVRSAVSRDRLLIVIFLSALVWGLESGVRNVIGQPYIVEMAGGTYGGFAMLLTGGVLCRTAGIFAYRFIFARLKREVEFVLLGFVLFGLFELVAFLSRNPVLFGATYYLGVFGFGWLFALKASVLNQRVAERSRATMLSADSMMENLGTGLMCFALASRVTPENMQLIWGAGAVCCFAAAALYVPMLRRHGVQVLMPTAAAPGAEFVGE